MYKKAKTTNWTIYDLKQIMAVLDKKDFELMLEQLSEHDMKYQKDVSDFIKCLIRAKRLGQTWREWV